MFANRIDEATVSILENFTYEPPTALNSHMFEQLKKLDLLSDGREQTSKAKKEINQNVPVVNMCLFLTQSCNLRCVYCYGDEGKYGTGGSMEEKTAFQAVDWMTEQAGKMEKLHIGFFGGDPFLSTQAMPIWFLSNSSKFLKPAVILAAGFNLYCFAEHSTFHLPIL